MESLCRFHHRQLPYPLQPSFSRPPPSSSLPFISMKPLTSRTPSRRPQLSLRASHTPPNPAPSFPHNPPKQTLDALSSLLKPACIALAAGAALFFARLNKPCLTSALAAPPHPAAQSEALPSSRSSRSSHSPAEEDSETLTEEAKERILEEYLNSHPDDVRSLRALMELKIKAGKLPEAIGIVDRLILLEPGENDLPLLKAHLQSYAGDTESAKLGFEELLQKDPLLVEAYHGLVMTASQSESDSDLGGIVKRIEGAMELCKKAKKKEDLRDFKLLMAQVKVMEGNYQEALKVYEELVKEEPRDFRPYLCQGIIYTLLRKKDEAEKQFQKYRRLVPKGHPYAQYFDENMIAMKVFSQIDENKRTSSLKS